MGVTLYEVGIKFCITRTHCSYLWQSGQPGPDAAIGNTFTRGQFTKTKSTLIYFSSPKWSGILCSHFY